MLHIKKLIIILIVIVFISVFLISQQHAARITGRVVDEGSIPLRDVSVKATSLTNGDVTTTKSNKKGNFRLMSLAPSEYKVAFSLEGYQTYVISWVVLKSEQTVNLNVTLKKKVSAE